MGNYPKRERHQRAQYARLMSLSLPDVAGTAGAAARSCSEAVVSRLPTAPNCHSHLFMAYNAMCRRGDASCLEEPYPATGSIKHDAACNDAVRGSGQDSCLCRHLRCRSTRKQWDRAVAGPECGSLTHRLGRLQIGSCVGRFKV
jgi:hypothetical protein